MDYRSRMLWMLFGIFLVQGTSGQSLYCHKCTNSPTCNVEEIGAFPCKNATDQCFVHYVSDNKIDRGCLQEIASEADRQKCRDETDLSCSLCNGFACNSQIWPMCHVCQEATDASCRAKQSGVGAFCGKYGEKSSCFQRIVDGLVERGCKTEENPCEGNEHCVVCDGANCNDDAAREFQVTKCVQCKADDTDVDGSCLSGSRAASKCEGPSDGKCYSRIVEGAILERGCQGNLEPDDIERCNGTRCEICPGDGCNKGVFPADRLTCNQCKSTNSSDCSQELTDGSKSVICRLYKETNRCYSRIGLTDHFERGCESDLGYHANACDNVKDCMVCAGKNCNIIAAAQLEQLPKCQRCTSNTNDNCDKGSVTPTVCGDHLEDSCVTQVQDGVLKRDCLSMLDESERTKCSDDEETSCHKCSGQGCNDDEWLKCYQCKSSTDKTCSNNQNDNLHSAYCRVQHDDDKCYTRIVDNVLERGCQSDLGEDVEACDKLDDKHCQTCDDANCNGLSQNKLKSAAGNVAGSLVLLAASALTAVLLF